MQLLLEVIFLPLIQKWILFNKLPSLEIFSIFGRIALWRRRNSSRHRYKKLRHQILLTKESNTCKYWCYCTSWKKVYRVSMILDNKFRDLSRDSLTKFGKIPWLFRKLCATSLILRVCVVSWSDSFKGEFGFVK